MNSKTGNMIPHISISKRQLSTSIRAGKITFAGNRGLRIYGQLSCTSGKRMKKINRVFFVSEGQARRLGFRPCGHCMKKEYLRWKGN